MSIWIRKLQEAEQSKLQLTIGMHVERKRLAGVKEAVDLVGKAAGLPAAERRGVEAALVSASVRNEAHLSACPCSSTQASIQAELGELEEEMVQRQEETVKLMQIDVIDLISRINEILDEIRYWDSS